MTNDLPTRMRQHAEEKGNKKTFAGRYYCYKLIYFERYDRAIDAIDREKEIKGCRREKKVSLIESQNPRWDFLDPEALN